MKDYSFHSLFSLIFFIFFLERKGSKPSITNSDEITTLDAQTQPKSTVHAENEKTGETSEVSDNK